MTHSSSGNGQTQDHWQKTIAQPIELGGIGVHSGRFIEVVIRPAPANHGIVFLRSDIGGTNAYIPATVDYAVPHNLCTRIENEDGIGVNTIEHFMAAFHGLEIDNLLVEIDGPEMPILDGSATPIFRMLKAAGIEQQNSPRAVMTIVKEIELDLGDGVRACLSPCDHLEIDVSIHFDDHLIGTQAMSYINNSAAFEAELADARTFCLLKDVEAMRNAGMARGGSLDNAVVVHNGSILNDGGLRSADEFVRHKTLDCLGDLYLLGMSLKARLTTNKPGHALSTKLLKALMASPDSFCVEKPNDDLPVNRQWAYPESAVAARS